MTEVSTGAPALDAVADRLLAALRDRSAIPAVRDDIPDVAAAYRVQRRLMAARETAGNPLVGRKVGLTAEAVQRQLGVDQPDFGILLEDMRVGADGVVPLDRLIQAKAEAEVAFLLGRDVDATDRESVLAAVEWVAAAIEIVDSRIENWGIRLIDTIADNASSAMYVLGTERRTLAEVEPKNVEMRMSVNGEVVSTGTGADCLGDPVEALVWVARTAAEQGRPLRAGEVVLSGALGPMATLHEGDVVTAEVSDLGTVRITAGMGGAG